MPIDITDRRRRLFERVEAGRISGFIVRTELVSLSVLSTEAWRHVEGSRDRDMLDEPTQHGHIGTCLASLYHFGSGLGFSSSTKTGPSNTGKQVGSWTHIGDADVPVSPSRRYLDQKRPIEIGDDNTAGWPDNSDYKRKFSLKRNENRKEPIILCGYTMGKTEDIQSQNSSP